MMLQLSLINLLTRVFTSCIIGPMGVKITDLLTAHGPTPPLLITFPQRLSTASSTFLRPVLNNRGGFIIDAIKGSPSNQAPLQPINSQDAASDYRRLLQGVGLAQNQAQVTGQGVQGGVDAQQAILAQLLQQAQGQGVNPAQAMLNQATGQNVAQSAALAAGVRGASANPGAVARQVAQTGAGIQQNAAGQAAILQAQQQQAAQQQAAALGGQLVGQGQQGAQTFNAAAMQPLNQLTAQNQSVQGLNQANQAGYGASTGIFGMMAGGGAKAAGAAHGGKIPGEAMVPGDSEENDVVPTMLSPGEIVIPRSYASDPKAAAAFAHACAMFSGKGKK